MKLYIAADHAGYTLKEALRPYLSDLGHTVTDCGALALEAGDDYPDFVLSCARQVAGDAGSFGIVIGASGQGEAMVANRVLGIRAAVYYGGEPRTQMDAEGAELGLIASVRAHNDANVLSLGARFVSEEEAKAAVTLFLETPFSGAERHVRRIAKF